MKFYPLLAVAVFFVAGPFGITEAYSPFGAYNRALPGNVWVRARAVEGATAEDQAIAHKLTETKRPSGFPVFHSALAYGKRAGDSDGGTAERRAFHSALPFGKRTAMDRRGFHSGLPFGKRGQEEAEQDALMERRGYNSALMFGKRIHSALPFGKRDYHTGLPFGKRSTGDDGEGMAMDQRNFHSGVPYGKRLTGDDSEGLAMDRRDYHSGLPFGKRDDGADAAVSDILSQLRSED